MSDTEHRIEEELANWLAHPLEFGVRPKAVRLKRTYKTEFIGRGIVEIHLVEYTMPDGVEGRGFVFDSLTWSFLGESVNLIQDDDLFTAYCGWAWLFPALQAGNVQTAFSSADEEPRLLAKLGDEGLEDIRLGDRYKIGTSELFEFTAVKEGKIIKGVGDSEDGVRFESDDPRSALPAIYFLLGEQVVRTPP